MPVDPSMAVSGAEWQIQPLEPVQPAQETGTGFGGMLGSALDSLAQTQTEAATTVAKARISILKSAMGVA